MSAPAVLATGHYVLAPSRCAVRFIARGFGMRVPGEFDIRTGEVTIDPSGASVTAVLDAGSFRTGNARRDRDVLSARFLDTEHHPDISFAGRWDGPGTSLVGDLTVKGVSAAVSLDVGDVDSTGRVATVRARTRVDRRVFAVGPRFGPVGRWVDVELEIGLETAPPSA